MTSHIFISSMARSGSTLLDKLLNSHRNLTIHSQPFPYIFIEAKRRFYQIINHPESYYFLNHYFGENHYQIDQLNGFLEQSRWKRTELINLINAQQGYSGQQTSHDRYHGIDTILPDEIQGFDPLLRKLLEALPGAEGTSTGSKEILCEEFMPYLASHGFRTILIVRDPRDVLTSINRGKGEAYFGKPRPTLFHLRNWRKSVAFSILLEGHPNFLRVRYEDLVTEPKNTMGEITDFLRISPLPDHCFEGEIHDQNGRAWDGNSSHGSKHGISTSSLGGYRQHLSIEMTRYIEYVCFPEMRYLGYPLEKNSWNSAHLTCFREPFDIRRPELPQDYSQDPVHIKQEKQRQSWLQGDYMKRPPDEVLVQWFLSPAVFQALAEAVASD